MAVDVLGRRSIGVDQPLGGSIHPYADHDAILANRLADFRFTYYDPSGVYEPPFSFAWLYRMTDSYTPSAPIDGYPDPVNAADFVLVDANGLIAFDSTISDVFEDREWGNRLRVLQWRQAEA